jgi:hypothetical protein
VDPFVDALADPALRPAATAVIERNINNGSIPRTYWFGIWMFLRDADRAFRDFDTGLTTQDIWALRLQESDFLRDDPRYPALLESVDLPTLPGSP